MKLFVAMLLLGQVGNGAFQPGVIEPLASAPPVVEESGEEQPSVSSIDTSAPSRPSAQFSVQDDNALSTRRSPKGPAANAVAPAAAVQSQAFNSREAPARQIQTAPESRPAAGATLAPASQSEEASQMSASLLESILAPDGQMETPVKMWRLVDVVSRVGDSQSQATAIGAYWELALTIGRARFAQERIRLLTSVPQPNSEADAALLEAAIAAAEAQEEGAQDERLAAQYRLMRVSGAAWEGVLPWPADMPLVSAYRTNFDSYFAQRVAPLEIRHLHQSLPGKLRLVERCVVSIAAAETAADATIESYKSGRGSVTLVLETIDRLEKAQNSFLTAVIDYNDRIAEYSLSAVGPSLGPETLVSTLIKTAPGSNRALATIPNGVRQVNSESSVYSDERPTLQR